MKTIDTWLAEYGKSHQNATNKLIHWVCVPLIMFTIFGLLYAIPFPLEKSLLLNWAGVGILVTLLFYLRLSLSMFIGFVIIGGLMLLGNHTIATTFGTQALLIFSVSIFALAWVGQFIGHKIEGAKPSFFEDIQFLLIGPAWLLHFIFKKIGIKY